LVTSLVITKKWLFFQIPDVS